jgi:hypothetical protein
MLDFKQQWGSQSSHGPLQGGSIGCHLAETKWSPPERHNSSGMVLPEDFRQGDPGSTEAPQHRPMILEDLFLLRLRGAIQPVPPRLADEFPVYARSANSGSFRR